MALSDITIRTTLCSLTLDRKLILNLTQVSKGPHLYRILVHLMMSTAKIKKVAAAINTAALTRIEILTMRIMEVAMERLVLIA